MQFESGDEFHSPRKGEERRCAGIACHIYNRVKLFWRKIIKKFSQESKRSGGKKRGERERPRRKGPSMRSSVATRTEAIEDRQLGPHKLLHRLF